MEFGYKEESKSPFAAIIREWPVLLIEVIVAIVLGYLVTSHGLERIQVSGNSMNLILQDGDTILVNKMAYKIFSPSRNDVIVFRQEGQEHNYYSL